jgi:multidrug efflux pump subunit AcrA (membrane-fusion protein)
MIRWATILLALMGLSVAIFTIATATHQPPKAPLEATPSINPYPSGLAASGTVEASTRNIQVAAPEGALVMRVLVGVNDRVRTGDPLFELDSRALQADLIKARAAKAVAEAQLHEAQAQPRPESLPPLESAVQNAQAELADWTDQYERFQAAAQQVAGTDVESRRRWYAMQGARARLAQAEANLALARAGAWAPELEVLRAGVAQAEAGIAATQALIDRRTVRSPIDGTVLKRNIEPGQFAPAEPARAAMVIGNIDELHIRARVDEEDVPRLVEGAAGTARLRGAADITIPLTMLRIEPLAAPKTELTGATTERVDTRVLEVIFRVDGTPRVPIYPGQVVDVFIEARPVSRPAPPNHQ